MEINYWAPSKASKYQVIPVLDTNKTGMLVLPFPWSLGTPLLISISKKYYSRFLIGVI